MFHKTITISLQAYEAPRRSNETGEVSSEAILRLARSLPDLPELVGVRRRRARRGKSEGSEGIGGHRLR